MQAFGCLGSRVLAAGYPTDGHLNGRAKVRLTGYDCHRTLLLMAIE